MPGGRRTCRNVRFRISRPISRSGARKHGYEIIRWLIDDAISGTSAKGRNAFEQMLATAENGRDFDTVLCDDISRFSRGGTNETGFYLHRLKLEGVDVILTADGNPEGDEGELIQGVKSWQALQYSIKLARDTIRGQISNIRERKSAPGGMALYGYDKQHITADGTVLRTLCWMPDGSKQVFRHCDHVCGSTCTSRHLLHLQFIRSLSSVSNALLFDLFDRQ
jgi:hypothetical protein